MLQAGGVLAHELGHAYFATAGFPDLPLKLEEGMCEVWKILWLQSMLSKGESESAEFMSVGALLAAKTLNSKDPVYGDGAREAMKAMHTYGGWPAVLAYVKRRAKLPDEEAEAVAGPSSAG